MILLRPERLPEYRPGECQRCRGKSTLRIDHVRPAYDLGREPDPIFGPRIPAIERSGLVRSFVVYGRWSCVNRDACEARMAKRSERARARSQVLVLEEPKAPDAPRGTCRWCGDPIYRSDIPSSLPPVPDRRRSYHYGPESSRYGGTPRPHEPDCYVAWTRSRTWDARIALRRRDGGVCAGCGIDAEAEGGPGWEADHIVALEDGGEHSLENLQTLCAPCHHRKTARENAARRVKSVA